jgi:hypothetical protein
MNSFGNSKFQTIDTQRKIRKMALKQEFKKPFVSVSPNDLPSGENAIYFSKLAIRSK